MSGNVYEWCEDVAYYTSYRRFRSGSWDNYAGGATVAYRGNGGYQDARYGNVGFRLVRGSGN